MGVFLTVGRLLYLMLEVTKITFVTLMGKLIPGAEERRIKYLMSAFRDKRGVESALKAFEAKEGDDGEASVFSFLKQQVVVRYNDLIKEATLNGRAQDCTIIHLGDNQTGNTLTNLLKFQKRGRPLVLNFGSCT